MDHQVAKALVGPGFELGQETVQIGAEARPLRRALEGAHQFPLTAAGEPLPCPLVQQVLEASSQAWVHVQAGGSEPEGWEPASADSKAASSTGFSRRSGS